MNDAVTPLVSVVIPTYNHARFLGRALQSVLNQTYPNWEVIVIDNHSTDNTDEVLASVTDLRIACIKINNNGVIAASRNAGIRAARGDWIAFLDSDDWWTIDKLQVCLDWISDKVDLVYHDLEIVSEQPRHFRSKIIKSWQVITPVVIDLMKRGNAIATSSVVVRKKILMQLNGMNESRDMVAAEDYNTWLRIAQLTNGFRYVSNRLGFYQLHNQGVSRKDISMPVQHAAAEFVNLLSQQQKQRFQANLIYTKGRCEYLAGNYVSVINILKHCILYGSFKIRPKAVYMYIMAVLFLRKDH